MFRVLAARSLKFNEHKESSSKKHQREHQISLRARHKQSLKRDAPGKVRGLVAPLLPVTVCPLSHHCSLSVRWCVKVYITRSVPLPGAGGSSLAHDQRHLDRMESGLGLGSLAVAEETAARGAVHGDAAVAEWEQAHALAAAQGGLYIGGDELGAGGSAGAGAGAGGAGAGAGAGAGLPAKPVLNQRVIVTRATRHTFGATGFSADDEDGDGGAGDGSGSGKQRRRRRRHSSNVASGASALEREQAAAEEEEGGGGAAASRVRSNAHSHAHDKTFGSTFSTADRLKSSIAVAQMIAKSAKELGKYV
jgi:hypothetical protein